MKKSLLAIALTTATISLVFSGVAKAEENGWRLNGTSFNGFHLNGCKLQGTSMQATKLQGMELQNLKVEGGQLVAVTRVAAQ